MKNASVSIDLKAAASHFKKESHYWMNKLSGELVRSSFPYDSRNRSSNQFDLGSMDMEFPGETLDRLKKISAGNEAKLFMVLTSVFILLLEYYSDNQDIIIGTPVLKQTQGGDFINSLLALRSAVNREMTFKELLLQVRQSVIESTQNQNYPIEMLVSQLNMQFSEEHFPLFDVVIQLENIHDQGFRNRIKPNMIVSFNWHNEMLKGRMEYNSHLYEETTIKRIGTHFILLLDILLQNPDILLSELEIFNPKEKEELLTGFNQTDLEYPGEKNLVQLFEEQVRHTPDKIAVVHQDQFVTFGRTDTQANRLAHYLLGKEIQKEEAIGILMMRGVDQIVAIFGILKAGGAYVPIDSGFPGNRIRSIINDAGIRIVISRKEHIRILNKLQWECPDFITFLCVNSHNIFQEEEREKSDLMDIKLWDFVAESATDEVTGGGWFSSYTGKAFTREEMDEYGDNVLKKLKPIINENMRVLEIGCASGLTMYRIAALVTYYHGTDLSPLIIENNQKRVKEEGILNIRLTSLPAHEIDQVEESGFDLVIINSVLQSFHGHNYLRNVFEKVMGKLNDQGHIFVGDVMDLELKGDLEQSVRDFKRNNTDKEARTKIDFSNELFLSREFFQDLQVEFSEIEGIEFSEKLYTIENELTKFRYDTLIKVDKDHHNTKGNRRKFKYQEDHRALSGIEGDPLQLDLTPENLAYIIYTSGSTGEPKGVMVEHRNVHNLVLGLHERIYQQYPGNMKVALMAPYMFDASVQQIFGALLKGHSLFIIPEDMRRDAGELMQYYKKNKIQVSDGTPVHLRLMLESANEKGLHMGVKHFIIGGEALPKKILENFFKACNASTPKVTNIYGPAECCVDTTSFEAEKGNIGSLDTIPIGKPLPNHQVYILDKQNRLSPIGVPGELCISGHGVSRGYLKRDQLNREKFTENPFKKDKRMYRTGDLARWLSDGNIEFLGRIDNQVKVRGFRIELEEIESQLRKHDDIRECRVITKEGRNGDTYLCAYMIPETQLELAEVREFLSQGLPSYMVPAFFVTIDEFPLTPNGKIDWKSLPEPNEADAVSGVEYTPPGDSVEQELVAIWEQVLGRKKIGIHENFFMIGGDSIKSIQIAARMKKNGYKVEMRDIFQNQTIAELSPLVRTDDRIADQSVITGIVPLTPIQQIFFEHQQIDPFHFNQAVMLYSKEEFDPDGLLQVIEKVQAHHDALRMTFKKDPIGELLQTNHGLDYPKGLTVYDLRDIENPVKELEKRANVIQASIDLEKGPLMKMGLFKLLDGDRLLIVVHHLVMDGVSWQIILEDVKDLYKQYQKREELRLPPKTDSFKRWSEELVKYANHNAFLKEKKFWAAKESIIVPCIKRDKEDIENLRKDTSRYSIGLTGKETQQLVTRANIPFSTEVSDLLMAALGLAVKKIFGYDKMLIAQEGHGREEILKEVDINRTVGWFTSIYPVILDSAQDQHLSRYIKEVKESLRQIPNKGVGYGILKYMTRKELKQDIQFKLNPQVSFNYWGQFDMGVEVQKEGDVENQGLTLAKEPAGHLMSTQGQREYDFDFSGMISSNKLILNIEYNKTHFYIESIQAFMEAYKTELLRIIRHCTEKKEKELTPIDVTHKNLTIDQLESIVNIYGKENQHNIQDIYALSATQESFLFHDLMDKTSSAYFEQLSFRFRGQLDSRMVEKSFDQLVLRHDILRTNFIHEGLEHPLQVVFKEAKGDFFYKDIRKEINKEKKEEIVKTFKKEDMENTFDLVKGSLMRLSVLKLSEAEYEFIWSNHHILIDGWCVGILISEFFEIYNSIWQQREYRLPPVKPFRIYIEWLQNKDKDVSSDYWKKYLEHYDELVRIPRDSVKGIEKQGYLMEKYLYQLDKEQTEPLVNLASRNQVTVNTVMQSLWAILLGRYNMKQDVVFGAVVSGRPSSIEDVETMIGLFINTVPVRVVFNEKMQFNELLRNLQEEALDSEPHHHFPLAEIQSISELNQNLLDHILVFENYPVNLAEGVTEQKRDEFGPVQKEKPKENTSSIQAVEEKRSPLELEVINVEVVDQTTYDLVVLLGLREQLSISIEYNGWVFEKEFIKRVVNHLLQMLNQVVINEEQKLEDIQLLPEEEKKQVLYQFNQTGADYPREKVVQEFFQEQVMIKPDSIVLTEISSTPYLYKISNQLTHQQVNIYANQIAWELKSRGVHAGEIVGLLLNRNVKMIAGILGVLKSGAVYLPLDPEYPKERKQFMIQDTGIQLLLTQKEILDKEKSIPGKKTEPNQILCIDDERVTGSQRLENPERINTPQDPVYVIYTSGTTGRPKGVVIQHYNVVRLLAHTKLTFDFADHVWTLFHSYCFDFSVWEMYGVLFYGGRLVIIPSELARDTRNFLFELKRQKVSILNQTPSAFYSLIGEDKKAPAAEMPLRFIIFGGEALNPTKLLDWRFRYPKIRLINMFGITETTVHATLREVSYEDVHSSVSNIGISLPTLRIYILDPHLNPQPIDVPGELCVAGEGVGRGYLNRPELTQEKFLESPFSQGEPFYRSGDLAKWLPNGNMEYLGRIDQQVKIRGYRIEPGEVENQILKQDKIKKAVVLVRENNQKEKYLCAYVTSDQEVRPSELRESLSQTLPGYMIPAYIIQVDRISLTLSGKVDKRALPDPGSLGTKEVHLPINQVEEALLKIWSEVLDLDATRIGTHDSFFDLGGHSLKATILVSRVRKEFDVEFPLNQVFSHPSITQCAEIIQKARKGIHQSIHPAEKKEYYPQSSAQKRLFFLGQFENIGTSYNIPLVLKLKGSLKSQHYEATFKELIQRHEPLRTAFLLIDNEPVQKVFNQVEFEIQELETGNQQREVKEIIQLFAQPFELNQAPLIRVAIAILPDNDSLLLIDIHHIVCDGTSTGILLEDFMKIYQEREMKPLRIQYKDYSLWQHNLYQDGKISQQMDYWKNQFPDSDHIPRLNLHTDYPRPELVSFKGSSVSFSLGKNTRNGLKKLETTYGTTLYMNLMAVFNVLLFKYTRQKDIVVGSGIMGRPHADLLGIIGMFINMLALRNQPEPPKTFQKFLEEVRENSIQAFENQDIQFEELIDTLQLERDPSRNPLVDVSFVVQNFERAKKQDQPTSFEPVAIENSTSKFDLTLFANEVRDHIFFNLEYCTRLFKEETIQRLSRHFIHIIEQVIQEPVMRLSEISLLTEQEKNTLLNQFNQTQQEYPKQKTLDQLVEEQVEKNPNLVALQLERENFSYHQLREYTRQLAWFLHEEGQVHPGEFVGIILERSFFQIATLLGVIKSGGAYVPMEPTIPEERMKIMIREAQIRIVLSQKKYLRTLNRLQWECACLETYVCLDTENIYAHEETEVSQLMDKKLWDYVGQSAEDDISGGGWKSSYTGEYLSAEEMDEYGDNVLEKLKPILRPGMRVLEIGCASGITMYRIAPKVAYYCGTDLSEEMIKRNRERIQKEEYKNIELFNVSAEEIHTLEEQGFDLVIINSVIQCFPGHHYLRKMIKKAIRVISDNGYIFIGDIMDQDTKADFIKDLKQFKESHREQGYQTRTDLSQELFVSQGFFRDLPAEIPGIIDVESAPKKHTIENELTKYRYDTIITIDKGWDKPAIQEKKKYQWDNTWVRRHNNQPFISLAQPENLVYGIYTSGTTGQPKAVLMEHQMVVNTIYCRANLYQTGIEDRALLLFSYAFDGFVTACFTPLIMGSKIVLPTPSDMNDYRKIKDMIKQEKITRFISVPILFQAILENAEPEDLQTLEIVTLAGDKIPSALLEMARTKNPRMEVSQEYGVTEAAVMTTINRHQESQELVTIGRPIWNHQVCILDDKEQLLPVGVPGELYISGDGLARGYLNKPQLTHEKFVTISKPQGFFPEKLYKTGDLARWNSTGNIEFIGRLDDQVKVRGFRIETDDIRMHIITLPEVKDAVVIAVKDEQGQPELMAFLQFGNLNQDVPLSEIRDHLNQYLPSYMIPTRILSLEQLPLTATGKIDKKALLQSKGQELERGTQYQAPGNEMEKLLKQTWETLLGVEEVGIRDNFFMIGGDSIKTIQVKGQLNKAGFTIEMKHIFQNQTIAELAPYVRKITRIADQSAITGEVAFTPIQRIFFSSGKKKPHHFNQAVMFSSKEGFEEETIRTVFSMIQEHHDTLRMSIKKREDGTRYLFTHGPELPISLVTLDLTRHEDTLQAIEQSANHIQSSIDLEQGPLMKIGHLHLKDGDRLLVVIHHLAVDGISWRILLEDIEYLYHQVKENKTPQLPLKTDSYQLWAGKLTQYANIDTFLKEKEYWTELESSEVLEIKKDFKGNKNSLIEAVNQTINFDEEITTKLLTQVNQAFETEINDILLTALGMAFSRVYGHPRLLIELEGHGREPIIKDIDISRTVGWFTSVYPVILDMTFADNMAAQICEIKQSLRQIPNKGIGYGILKYLTEAPLKSDIQFRLTPQINFNYLGQFDSESREQLLQLAREPYGNLQDLREQREYELYIYGMIREKKLSMSIMYSRKQFKKQTIDRIMDHYKRELTNIIQYCSEKERKDNLKCQVF